MLTFYYLNYVLLTAGEAGHPSAAGEPALRIDLHIIPPAVKAHFPK